MEKKKTKLKITSCKGRLFHTYPGQCQPQDRYIEVSANGELYISWNAEIGNAVPANVWHGIERRIHISAETKYEAKQFILKNYKAFQKLVDGMDTKLDATSNYIGTLTSDAETALEELEYTSLY